MKSILILSTLLFSMTAHSKKVTLSFLAKAYSEVYEQIGSDNNYLVTESFTHTDLNKIKSKFENATLKKIQNNEFPQVLKECVFITEGAYGEHIDEKTQDLLISTFKKSIVMNFFYEPTLYRVNNIDLEIFNNNCAVLIVDNKDKESVLIQGVAVD